MRTFILVLLLPAYAFAAVHVEPYWPERSSEPATAASSSVGCSIEAIDGDHDTNPALLSELSDTTDDVCDHCIPYTYEVTALRVRLWNPPLELPRAPDAVLRRALRPPSELLH
jgi:hypothetical protein